MSKVFVSWIILVFGFSIILNAQSKKDTFLIVGVGDMMLGTDFPSTKYLPNNGDCSGMLSEVHSYLKEADVTFGNLEGSMAGTHGKPKGCNDTTMCFVFRMPEHFISCFVDAGFDLLSIANNHSGDFGEEGRANTIRILKESNIGFAGLTDYPTYVLEREGVKIGFAAFSPHQGTPDINDIPKAKKIISELASQVDIVVVSFHGGAEGANYQHVSDKDEIYLGYNRGNMYQFSHAAIDAGADVIFGHGPHVTRAVELYKNRLIAYSLGNFCTYARFNLRGPNGIAPILRVNVNKQGEFLNGQIVAVKQINGGIPVIDPSKAVIQKVKQLTASDFPGSAIEIKDNGEIVIKN